VERDAGRMPRAETVAFKILVPEKQVLVENIMSQVEPAASVPLTTGQLPRSKYTVTSVGDDTEYPVIVAALVPTLRRRRVPDSQYLVV
jgi:hypothetical protein